MDRDVMSLGCSCFQSQRLGLDSEIPRVVYDNPRPCVGLFIGLV